MNVFQNSYVPSETSDGRSGSVTPSRSRTPCRAQHPVRRSSDLEVNALYPGAHIELVNLRMQSYMNGYEGILLDYDSAEIRWRVRLSDGAGTFVKPTSVELA